MTEVIAVWFAKKNIIVKMRSSIMYISTLFFIGNLLKNLQRRFKEDVGLH